MKVYLTAYSAGGDHYGAYIQASNVADARAVAGRRGLNEIVEGEAGAMGRLGHQLAKHIRARRWAEAAHEAAFLCFVGLESGAITAREALGDTGLVHELLHLLTIGPGHPDEAPEIKRENERERRDRIRRVTAMARDIEYRVPGHVPSFLPAHVERGRRERAAERRAAPAPAP